VCINRQRNSGYKAEQVKYRGKKPIQFPPPFPPLAFIYTPLTQKDKGRAASTLNTQRQARLMVSRYTCPTMRSCIGPAREAGLRTGTWKGQCHLVEKGKEAATVSSYCCHGNKHHNVATTTNISPANAIIITIVIFY